MRNPASSSAAPDVSLTVTVRVPTARKRPNLPYVLMDFVSGVKTSNMLRRHSMLITLFVSALLGMVQWLYSIKLPNIC
jgi:hypothetical protein